MSKQTRDTLNPENKQVGGAPRHGPVGDVQLNESDPDQRTRRGGKQEDVEDRPEVSTVTPEDYPKDQRAKG